MPRWIHNEDWNGIDETWRQCDCGQFPRRLVAYEGVDTGRKFMGCHYKSPKCTFVEWIDKPHSPELSRALLAMWRLAQPKEIKVSDQEFQQSLEEARQEGRDKVNAIKSTCLAVADVLAPLKEKLEALAKNV